MVEVNRNSRVLGLKDKIMILYMYVRLEKLVRYLNRNV